jgi:hypothetical protein
MSLLSFRNRSPLYGKTRIESNDNKSPAIVQGDDDHGALGTSKDILDLYLGADLLVSVERAAHRVHALRIKIVSVQHAIDAGTANGVDAGRQKGQPGLLHLNRAGTGRCRATSAHDLLVRIAREKRIMNFVIWKDLTPLFFEGF